MIKTQIVATKKVIMCSKKQKYTNLKKNNSRDAAHQKELPTSEINVT